MYLTGLCRPLAFSSVEIFMVIAYNSFYWGKFVLDLWGLGVLAAVLCTWILFCHWSCVILRTLCNFSRTYTAAFGGQYTSHWFWGWKHVFAEAFVTKPGKQVLNSHWKIYLFSHMYSLVNVKRVFNKRGVFYDGNLGFFYWQWF